MTCSLLPAVSNKARLKLVRIQTMGSLKVSHRLLEAKKTDSVYTGMWSDVQRRKLRSNYLFDQRFKEMFFTSG